MLIDAAARLEPEALRCPFPAYAELRERGVTFVEAANAWLVTRAEDVDAVLRDPETFSSRNAIGAPPIPPQSELARHVPFLLLSDEPEHAQRRKLVQRAFTPSRLARFEPRIRELCTALVDDVRGQTEVDAMAALAVPLPIAVITTVLGVPDEETASFRSLSEELAATVGNHSADPGEIVRIAKEFAALLAPSLEAAAAAGEDEDTILHTIAAAERTAGLPRHDSTRFVMELLIAGNITTTDHLGNSILLLARDPGLADRLRADPSRLSFFIEESLRLESPIQGLFRLTTRDTEVGGVAIPAGARVQVMYGSGNRDAALVERPDELDLARHRPSAHLAFGRGVHSCLGNILARLESRVALETLLGSIPRFELAVEPDQIDYLPSFVNRGPQELPLRLTW
ncbi:cytochrome P450 [Geodermatophilus sabuli]|uniref:Cytochrome P450 n=1 Tax=Geodermatophilus sabuli TaxID=1564158 RepID=A0A7K3VWU3_9ACTN|nr:cytochrome P450 [Geodermatophilus sabuli]NEK57119.1 cytochrome P450 [Geodermatophilus sabuli]